MRDYFTDVITVAVDDGAGESHLRPLGNVQITVYKVVNGVREVAAANIFVGRSGGAPKANPFTTTVDGGVKFWADPGDYDIVVHDLDVPARVGDQDIGWQALSAAEKAIPKTMLPEGGNSLSFPGMVTWTAAPAAAAGWLLCDGALLARADYADLFAAIGTQYNIGGESAAQFRLPDIKGRVIAGRDAGQTEFDVLGEKTGSKTVALVEANLPSHTHPDGTLATSSNGSHNHGNAVTGGGGHSHDISPLYWGVTQRSDGTEAWYMDPSDGAGNLGTAVKLNANDLSVSGDGSHGHGINSDGNHTHDVTGSTGATGSGSAHSNIQPTITLNAVIKI